MFTDMGVHQRLSALFCGKRRLLGSPESANSVPKTMNGTQIFDQGCPKEDPASCRAWLHGPLFVALLCAATVPSQNLAKTLDNWGEIGRDWQNQSGSVFDSLTVKLTLMGLRP